MSSDWARKGAETLRRPEPLKPMLAGKKIKLGHSKLRIFHA